MRKKINYRDLLERAAWTWVQSTLAIAIGVENDLLDASTWRIAAIGGLASVLSMAKTVMVQRYGSSDL